jgi:hypothetical protein
MGKTRAKPQMWDPAKARIEATRRMVGNFDGWPKWPILPMKKEIFTGSDSDLGVMVEEDSDTYNVYIVNLFRLKTGMDWDALPVEKFSSVEELIDAGWRVD